MKGKGERLLSLLSYFSGTIAAVSYLIGKEKAKLHGLQGLAFAAVIWVLEFFDNLLVDLDILNPMRWEGVLRDLFPYGGILAVIARLLYYIAVFIGIAAFFNIHLLFCKEE